MRDVKFKRSDRLDCGFSASTWLSCNTQEASEIYFLSEIEQNTILETASKVSKMILKTDPKMTDSIKVSIVNFTFRYISSNWRWRCNASDEGTKKNEKRKVIKYLTLSPCLLSDPAPEQKRSNEGAYTLVISHERCIVATDRFFVKPFQNEHQ